MKTKTLVASAVAASWVTIYTKMDFNLGLLVLAFWLCALTATFALKEFKMSRIMIALSAFTILPSWNFTKGIYDYTQGLAITHYSTGCGYSNDLFNIDRTTRMNALPTGGGCGWDPDWRDFLVNATYDVATNNMVKLFGYQKGSYTGIYLNADEANNLVEQLGEQIFYNRSRRKVSFRYNDKKHYLNLNTNFIEFDKPGSSYAKVYLLNDELMIFKPQNYSSSLYKLFGEDWSKHDESNEVYLIDAKTKKAFAVYDLNEQQRAEEDFLRMWLSSSEQLNGDASFEADAFEDKIELKPFKYNDLFEDDNLSELEKEIIFKLKDFDEKNTYYLGK